MAFIKNHFLCKKLKKLGVYILVLFVCTRCAQITQLSGGKKDVDPPKVLKAEPENVSLNFTSKKINLYFDEYIEIKDLANQFIITPQTKEQPEIEASGKMITIKFNEELLPNTTYKLSFGNAIVDLRESNILQNYEYIFSTGTTIDSLKFGGHIINAFNNKPASDILVGLYPATSNDSIIYKEKPLYISRTNGNGDFTFSYLPDASFKLVGIKDQNKNLLYDGSEEEIAFQNNVIDPKSTEAISLLLFKEVSTKSFIKKSASVEYGKAQIAFNKPQYAITDVTGNGVTKYMLNRLKDTITVFYNNIYDSLLTYIHYQTKKTDTVFVKIPSLSNIDKQKKNGAFKYNIASNITGSLPSHVLPVFDLNVPVAVKDIAETSITLIQFKDTVKEKKVITLLKNSDPVTSFTLQSEFKPETNYRLSFNKGMLSDENGRTSDSIVYNFRTTALEDYGQLILKLFFPKKENYIVMLLNEKEEVVQEMIIEFSLTSTSEKIIEYKNLLPGNYFIKIVEDINKNGLFNVGDYFLHQQPEPVFYNTTPIKLLAGWEIENEWQVK